MLVKYTRKAALVHHVFLYISYIFPYVSIFRALYGDLFKPFIGPFSGVREDHVPTFQCTHLLQKQYFLTFEQDTRVSV